jgi:hypothetical protein
MFTVAQRWRDLSTVWAAAVEGRARARRRMRTSRGTCDEPASSSVVVVCV